MANLEKLKSVKEELDSLIEKISELPIDERSKRTCLSLKEKFDQEAEKAFDANVDLDDEINELIERSEKVKSMLEFFIQQFDIEETKTVSKATIHQGRMHKVLGVKPGEDIKDKYKSGESLYKALDNRLHNHGKVMKMLNYAANISKEKDIFDAAVRFGKEHNG